MLRKELESNYMYYEQVIMYNMCNAVNIQNEIIKDNNETIKLLYIFDLNRLQKAILKMFNDIKSFDDNFSDIVYATFRFQKMLNKNK